MTTATKPRAKTDVLAGLTDREQAWAKAKAEADGVGSELGAKSRQAQALHDQRRRLIHHEPALVDHQGAPTADVKDNPVVALDAQLAALGDLDDLSAQYDHARRLEQRAKQGSDDYAAAHLDEILAELEAPAEATVAEVVRCMAELAEASSAYLGMAQRVNGLKGTVRQRQGLRVPAIDTASDLLNLSRDFVAPPSPTEIR